MIYTITLNPSLDYIVNVNHFTTGIVNRTSAERILPGGKGINVSIVLQNLGIENRALGFCAGDTGEMLCNLLEKQGVSQDFIKINGGMTRINVKMYSEVETEINGQGPRIEDAYMEQLWEKLEMLENGDILILAGSIPTGMPQTIYQDIMKRLASKQVKVVVDATKDVLMNTLPENPFLIKPNHHELGELFQMTVETAEDVAFYGRKLQQMGAGNVLVSMAEKGAVLIGENEEIYYLEAPKGKVINSVGAGDSMVAGFLAGYLKYREWKAALEMGICAGSASAFSAELAEKRQVMTLLEENFGWKTF